MLRSVSWYAPFSYRMWMKNIRQYDIIFNGSLGITSKDYIDYV